MITIVKGKEKIKCSYKTYENQFKQLGYLPISEEKKEVAKVTEKVLKPEIKVEAKVEVEPKVETTEKETTEEEKIGSKYGVRRRNSTKKED